ncbi:MAG: AbrB/MazE/SpoVT family DNA-binding domain-containing protein [Desulfuromusa sp.]|nr:AbrB/MazE/SpoVT family DNA-binding domain-containing protein [Desulfuromusa sp.]
MSLAKLSSKSQIVLPAPIRRQLNISPGDELEIAADDNVITIRKAARSATAALDSCGDKIWKHYDAELDEERNQWNG